MVIVDLPVRHGPHLWYSSHVFCAGNHYFDFLRLREAHVKLPRNEYVLTQPEPEGRFLDSVKGHDEAFWAAPIREVAGAFEFRNFSVF